MNWHKDVRAPVSKLEAALADAETTVSAGEEEGEPSAPADLVAAAESGAVLAAQKLARAREEVQVTLAGHAAPNDVDGFQAGHVVITVSRVDSEGIAKQEAEAEAARAEVAARQEAESAASAPEGGQSEEAEPAP